MTTEDLDYFANNLANERNFVKNLDTILIPRTVGSEGSRKVREVSVVCCVSYPDRPHGHVAAHQDANEEGRLDCGGAQLLRQDSSRHKGIQKRHRNPQPQSPEKVNFDRVLTVCEVIVVFTGW